MQEVRHSHSVLSQNNHTHKKTTKKEKTTHPKHNKQPKPRKTWEGKRKRKLHFQLLPKTFLSPLQKLAFAFTYSEITYW